jgi:hypothetical protein
MKIVAGKKPPGKYRQVQLQEIVGKVIAAVGTQLVPGAYGEETSVVLFFTDNTKHGFVIADDDD